jgi:hypothetical protein
MIVVCVLFVYLSRKEISHYVGLVIFVVQKKKTWSRIIVTEVKRASELKLANQIR